MRTRRRRREDGPFPGKKKIAISQSGTRNAVSRLRSRWRPRGGEIPEAFPSRSRVLLFLSRSRSLRFVVEGGHVGSRTYVVAGSFRVGCSSAPVERDPRRAPLLAVSSSLRAARMGQRSLVSVAFVVCTRRVSLSALRIVVRPATKPNPSSTARRVPTATMWESYALSAAGPEGTLLARPYDRSRAARMRVHALCALWSKAFSSVPWELKSFHGC